MGLKRKQVLAEQKACFEKQLKDRLACLAGKGIASPKADKDTLVRKWKANVKAANKRLRTIAAQEKLTEDLAKAKVAKAARAAAGAEEKEAPKAAKGEKPKKGGAEGKEGKAKKPKGEAKGEPKGEPKGEAKAAAPKKAPEGDKS